MTDTQILELAEKYLDVFPDDITSTKEQLLKFAREMYEKGKEIGYWEGYEWDELTELDKLIAEEAQND